MMALTVWLRRVLARKRGPAMKESQFGPCGLYCGACGATDCDGCLSDDVDEYVQQCKFRRCTHDKNLEFCCFCDEYPCAALKQFMTDEWPHHWTMEPNLEYIKTHGKDKWLQVQRKEWQCTSCGAEIKWYQRTCTCGKQLDAWDVPE